MIFNFKNDYLDVAVITKRVKQINNAVYMAGNIVITLLYLQINNVPVERKLRVRKTKSSLKSYGYRLTNALASIIIESSAAFVKTSNQ